MNKYELTLVVSAKIDEEARTAVVDKVKSYIEKANATITSFSLMQRLEFQLSLRLTFVLWNQFLDIFALD